MVKSFRGRALSSSLRSSLEDSAPALDPQTDCYAKIMESRGKGQFLVSLPTGTSLHVYMPPKFRNAMWIRRGSFVIIRKYSDSNELLYVLSRDQIKEIKKEGNWPVEFTDPLNEESEKDSEGENEDESETDGYESDYSDDC